mgnify:CR=1 FL=1|tara:strand:+ start:3755 stop:5218 length:1464 start_codon:yes stop_codon:yes gene_type:complete
MKKHWELAFKSAWDLRKLILNKEVSPVNLIEDALLRLNEINPKLNAFLEITFDEAIAKAKIAETNILNNKDLGLLYGIPISIKDNISTAGIKTTFGSLIFKDNIPNKNHFIVDRLNDSGAISIGKTNLPEFGMIATTENFLGEDCVNPWDITRIAGGSSGGASSSVASGITPLAQGSDGGGSIRIPAAFCGNYGIKPTVGRIPTIEQASLTHIPQLTFTAIGPISRNVIDSALFLQSVSGPHTLDPNCIKTDVPNLINNLNDGIKDYKIGWSPDLCSAIVEPEVKDITQKAAMSFEKLGANLEHISLNLNVHSLFKCFSTLMYTSLYNRMSGIWEEFGNKMNPWLQIRFEYGSKVSGNEFLLSINELENWKKKVEELFNNYDLILTPSISVTAFKCRKWPTSINSIDIDPFEISQNAGFYHFSYPFNMSGNPAASIPCGFSSEGLPIGLQIIGRKGDELSVLKASAAFEEFSPWTNKHPSIVNQYIS